MKYLLIIFMLLTVGCDRLKMTKNILFPTTFKAGTCFVNWSDPEDKQKFEKGRGMTRDQKSQARLLIPIFDPGVLVITDKTNSGYIVRLDWHSEKTLELVNSTLSRISNPKDELKQSLAFSQWELYPAEVMDLTEGYDEVNCEELQDSLYL